MAKYLFIIGAGASKAIHPNFPTGAELIERLMENKTRITVKILEVRNAILKADTSDSVILEDITRQHFKLKDNQNDLIEYYNIIHSLSIGHSYNRYQNTEILKEIFIKTNIVRDEFDTNNNYYQFECKPDKFLKNYTDPVKPKNFFLQLHINAENDLLDLLITELIAKFKPQSIDYFVREDIKTKLINYVAKAKELKLLKAEEGVEELEEKVSHRITERIVEILKDLTFKDYTNTWLYNILVNKIRLNSTKDVKFITFNYDLNIENIVKEIAETDDRIKSMPKVEHVYGNLKDGIHLIERKRENYRKKFIKAENIYFIGYGFDDLNNKNLGLVPKVKSDTRKWEDKKIFIHNYGGNSALEYKVSSIFKANFEFTREESRRFIDFSRNLLIFISEKKDINEVLSNDFFFEK